MATPKEGSFKLSLGPLKAKTGLKASPFQKDTKKSRLALDDDEPDESSQHQEILGWDAAEGGALDVNSKKDKAGPRIIPALPNRDWRAEAKRKQLAKAPHPQAQNGDTMGHTQAPQAQHGLIVFQKDKVVGDIVEEIAIPEPAQVVEKDTLTDEQRLEKNALDALLKGRTTDDDFVIPLQAEEDTFTNELRLAPEAPSLAVYEATPIEGFGAALLRGMGWKGEETKENNDSAAKPKVVKRRAALLGIGAKDDAAEGIELGAWGNKGKRRGDAQTYNPVTLQNKNTGEVLTEEELKAKLENQDMVQDEGLDKDRRRRIGNKDEKVERDERKREKRREKGDSGRGDRDDKYDSDRRRDKRRAREDDYDSERRKDKRRERSRDKDYNSERRREKRRERSRSPDDRKERRRDHYRSHSRETKRNHSHRDRSEESDDRRKRRRDREYEYDDDREDRKRRHKDEKYYKC